MSQFQGRKKDLKKLCQNIFVTSVTSVTTVTTVTTVTIVTTVTTVTTVTNEFCHNLGFLVWSQFELSFVTI